MGLPAILTESPTLSSRTLLNRALTVRPRAEEVQAADGLEDDGTDHKREGEEEAEAGFEGVFHAGAGSG